MAPWDTMKVESQARPHGWTKATLDKRHAEPPPNREREKRAHHEADHGITEPTPLAEHEPTQEARQLSRNRRNQHLQRLNPDERDRGQDPPAVQRRAESRGILVQAEQAVHRSAVRPSNPEPETYDGGHGCSGHRAGEPACPTGHRSLGFGVVAPPLTTRSEWAEQVPCRFER